MNIFRRQGLVFGFMLGVLAALAATQGRAATYYWDSNGSLAGAGTAPSGTWGSDAYWNTDSSGGSGGSFVLATSASDDLYFVANPGTASGSGAYTVAVSGTNSAASLNFQASGAATLSGGTINLGGGSTPGISIPQYAYAYTSNGAVTISATVALQTPQTWTNYSSNSLTVSGNVANGANTLTVGGAGNTTISGNFGNGAGGVVVVGPGTLTLSGVNSYTGGTTVSAGTLAVATTGALALYNTANKVTVGNGGTLSLSVGGAGWAAGDVTAFLSANKSGFAAGSVLGMDTTLAGTGGFSYGGSNTFISGNMGLAKAGTNTLTLTGSNTFTGGTTVGAGTLQLGDGTSGHDGSLSSVGGIYNNGTLTFNLAGSQAYAGIISGTGGLTKAGSGTLTLQVPNTFSGTTTITGGTLDLSSGGVLQQSMVLAPTASGASVVFDQSVSSGAFTFGGLTGSGNLSLQNNAASPAAIALSVGDNNSSTTYSGALSGSGSLTKAGGGTLVLSGSNSYSDGTTVSAGTLAVSTTGALALSGTANKVTVANGGTLSLSVGGSGWAAGDVGALLTANSGGFASGSVLGLDTTLAGTGGFSYGGTNTTIAGSMGLAKLGANTLILTATNTYTGPTTVSGGTLQFGDGTINNDGSLTSTAGIANNAALIYKLYGSQSYSGVISGFGSLTKAGTGALILEGTNTYSGPTTISGGTLQLGNGTSGQDGSLSNTSGITDNAALIYNLAGSQTYPGTITGTGTLTKSGTGTLTLSATGNAYTGGTTVSAGTLAVTSTGALAGYNTSPKLAVNSGATLAVSVGGPGWTASNVNNLVSSNSGGFPAGSALGIDTTLAGTSGFPYGFDLGGSLGLRKLGTGTLTLSGTNNTYSGGTTVSAGTLAVAGTGGLALYNTTGKVTVSSGATLALSVSGSGWTATNINNLISNNGSGFVAGSILGIDTTGGSLSCGYSIAAFSMGLTKLGSGTLTLSNSNTYTGPTTISGGTLDLYVGNALQGSTLIAPTAGSIVFDSHVSPANFTFGGLSGSGNLSVQNNAVPPAAVALTVGGNNGNTTYSGVLSGMGSLTKAGTGTLILAGSNTFAGGTIISGGTLQLGNGVSGQDGSLPTSGITDNTALVYDLAGSQTYSGVISGSGGSLTKIGAGTLTLSGTNNTYGGSTSVGAGTLAVTNTGALPGYGSGGKITVSKGATLTLSAGSSWTADNIDSLVSNNGTGFAVGSSLGIDTTGGSLPYGHSIAAFSLGLTKLGANTLTLSGTNTYTGGTTIAGGTLAVANTAALPGYNVSSKLTVNSGATLALSVGGAGWWASGDVGAMLTHNTGGFAPGSVLGIDTTSAGSGGFSYGGSNTSIAGNMGLTQLGPYTLTLTAANTFAGPTTVSGGTLDLANGNALQGSTLIAPTTGSLVFDSAVSSHVFTFGGLSGSGNIALHDSANTAIALTVGGNNGDSTYSGVLSGSGSLTKAGMGTLTLTGSNTFSGGTTVGVGTLVVASSGSLTSASGKNLYVGNTGLAAMTIQDSASVNVGGELDVNYQNTSGNPSTLTLTGGSLHVTGQTYIGRAPTRTDPGTTMSAAVYQSGGTATLSGKATVGYNGTALSFYDISGGMLNANGGLLVGGNLGNGNGQGNGLVDIAGSGVVNITGGAGLQIGQDTTLATSGLLSLSGSGTLSVTGNVSLGSGGGIAAFSRSGGSMTVTGGLIVGGNATLLLDASTANVATSFGGALSRVSPGTLVVIPNTGNLGTTEAVSFGTAPTRVNGIIGPWAVQQTSGTVTSGDYLTASGHNLATFSGYNSGFSGAGANSLVNVSSPSSTTGTTIYAMKVSDTATISSGTLTLSSGGMILNGGMVTGGTLAFSNSSTSLIYAGSSNPGTIASTIQGSLGLVKFGPGSLVLSGSNGQTLSGPIVVSSGTLNVQNSGALGAGGAGSPVTVAAGAALELQNNVALGNVPITLNGMGPSGGGALSNVQDNNSLAGTITLGSNSQINTTAGTLTLSGLIQGSYDLTTSGAGTLVLAGTSTLFGAVNITNGTVMAENSAALGPAGGIGTTVQSGATLGVQGGISLPAAVVLNGFGTGSGAALESFQGQNSLTGPVTLATDSQINVDAGMLTISGNISGASALSTGGTGTLVLSGTGNSFTGGLTVLSGTLSVPGVNNAGSPGPLGAGTTPVVLGSDSTAATLLYTGSGTSSNQAFTLAAGGGVVSVNSSLGLSGTIDGSGSLTKVGSGTLTLSGSNLYTGATTVASGTLAVSSTGSINSTSAIVVNQGALLQVTAGSTGQLPDSASITLNGGNLSYIGNGSTNPGELAGPLVLNPGQSNVAVSNTGSGTAYLCFASGPVSHTIGATVNFSPGSNSSIQFQAIAPLSNGIIGGYAFYNNGDFATWALAGSNNTPTIEQYTGYTLGNLASVGTSGSLNVSPTGSQGSLTQSTTINSLRLTNGVGVTITGSNVLALNSGGLIANTTGSISGGTLSAPNGELIVNTLQHLTISSAISASTALVKTGSDTLTLTSTTPVTGDTYLNQGILEYAPAGSVSYGGVISGAGNLLKSGTGSLTLTGTSTYYGGTSVTGGVFSVNGLLGAGTTVSVQGGGALAGSGTIAGNVVVSGGAIALGPSGSILGTVTANGSLTVGQSGVGDYLNTIGGLNIAGTGTLAASSTAATISGSLTYASSSNSTYSGVISGSGQTVTLGPSAAGTLTLSGSNLYTGGTFVQGGTLKTANPGALGTGGLTLSSGGTLDLDGLANLTVPSLSGAGGTILTSTGSSTLTVNTATGVSTNYSGTIANGTNGTGTLAFAKSGNGTLRLSGTGSYTGGTTVSGGVLIIDSSEAIPSGSTVAVSAGAMLILGDPSLPGYPMATGNTGSGAGVLQSDSSTSAVNSASGVSTDYGGSITGNVGLVKSGSGTLTLSGSNSYTGGTTINDGTLVLTNTAAIPDGSTVWMSTTGSGMLILGDPNLSDGLGLATGDVDSGAGIFQPTASPAVKATPEPGTLTLLLAGLVGLGVTTLRRRMKG